MRVIFWCSDLFRLAVHFIKVSRAMHGVAAASKHARKLSKSKLAFFNAKLSTAHLSTCFFTIVLYNCHRLFSCFPLCSYVLQGAFIPPKSRKRKMCTSKKFTTACKAWHRMHRLSKTAVPWGQKRAIRRLPSRSYYPTCLQGEERRDLRHAFPCNTFKGHE